MTQQTAVEWLVSEMNSRGPKENNPPQWLQELYDKAEEMEKEQIMDAHNQGYGDGYRDNGNSPIDYYSETFKQQ